MADPVGSIYGYRIVVTPPVPRGRAYRLADGLTVSSDDPEAVLSSALRRFSLDALVRQCQKLTVSRLLATDPFEQEITRLGWDPDLTFLPHTLRRLLTRAIGERALPDEQTRSPTIPSLRAAEQLVFAIAPDVDVKPGKSQGELNALALRVLQSQFEDQMGYLNFELETYLTMAIVDEAMVLGLDLDTIFRNEYGLSPSDMSFMSFALASTILANPEASLDSESLNRADGISGLNQNVIDAYWRRCSANYEELQRHAQDPGVTIEGYEEYSLSPIRMWPLVIRDDGRASAPIAGDLLHRGHRAFRIDALQAIDATEKSAQGTFNRALGAAYENYVGDTLTLALPGAAVEHGERFFGEGKRCDWVCDESSGVALVEVKSVWFRLGALTTMEPEVVKAELSRDGGLASAVHQLDESARSVRRGETRLRKQVPLQGLVVIRGSLVGLNTPHIRQLIEEIFEDRGLPPPIIKYHFANDVDFYELARFCTSGRSLNRLLYKKARDGIHQYDELHFYVERESSRGPELGRHPLAQAFDERLRELLGLYEPRLLNDPSLLKRRAR